MKVRKIKIPRNLTLGLVSFLVFIGLCVVLFVIGLWLNHKDNQLYRLSEGQVQVVATIFPIADMARQIIGDDGVVYQLVPNSANPHTYSPTPDDILKLNQADVVIFLGYEQEPWVQSMLDGVKNPDLVVVDLSQLGSELVESDRLKNHEETTQAEGERSDEFHYWLDFELSQQALQMIAQELSTAAPELAERFITANKSEQARWAELDEKYRLGLKNCQTQTVVYAGHSAFGHMAEKYDLRWLDALPVSPDAELAPKTLANLIQILQSENSLAVFTDAFFSPKLADTISQETGLPIIRLNPGERWRYVNGQNQEDGLIGIMEANLDKLQEGLGC